MITAFFRVNKNNFSNHQEVKEEHFASASDFVDFFVKLPDGYELRAVFTDASNMVEQFSEAIENRKIQEEVNNSIRFLNSQGYTTSKDENKIFSPVPVLNQQLPDSQRILNYSSHKDSGAAPTAPYRPHIHQREPLECEKANTQ